MLSLIVKNRKKIYYEKSFFDACQNKDYEKVEYYTSKVSDINIKNKDGKTALYMACCKKDEKLVEILLKKGANPNIKDTFGKTPIDLVCNPQLFFTNREKLIGLLLHNDKYDGYEKIDDIFKDAQIESSRSDIDIKDTYNMDIAKIFVRNIKNINWQDKDGNTILHKAIANSYTKITDVLLDRGIDTNIQNNLGYTALHIATINKNIEAVEKITKGYKDDIYYILESNSKVTKDNKTVLDIAKNSSKEIQNILNKQNDECIIKCLIKNTLQRGR